MRAHSSSADILQHRRYFRVQRVWEFRTIRKASAPRGRKKKEIETEKRKEKKKFQLLSSLGVWKIAVSTQHLVIHIKRWGKEGKERERENSFHTESSFFFDILLPLSITGSFTHTFSLDVSCLVENEQRMVRGKVQQCEKFNFSAEIEHFSIESTKFLYSSSSPSSAISSKLSSHQVILFCYVQTFFSPSHSIYLL